LSDTGTLVRLMARDVLRSVDGSVVWVGKSLRFSDDPLVGPGFLFGGDGNRIDFVWR